MSSIFVNLSSGMHNLGHEIIHLSDGDGYKKTHDARKNLMFSKSRIKRLFSKSLIILFPRLYLGKYDVIHIVNTNLFGVRLNALIIKRIKKSTKLLVLTSAGSNYFSYKYLDNLEYSAINELIKYDSKGHNPFVSKKYIYNDYKITETVDLIIPNTFTYSQSFLEFKNKLSRVVPYPLNLSMLEEYLNHDKSNIGITILYGITRNGFKGSRYILPALKKIKQSFPDLVNIRIVERIPLKEFLDEIAHSDIVVDQALSYEYGYNALYAMALGKVVLSGNNSPEFNELIQSIIPNAPNNPVIDISPNSVHIYTVLKKLVLNPEKIREYGTNSYNYVRLVHNHNTVASIYSELYLHKLNNFK